MGPRTCNLWSARAQVARCLAELGAFAEGRAYAEDALQLAETVDRPYSYIWACSGVGHFFLRQGELSQAIHVFDRCRGRSAKLRTCRESSLWHVELGVAYALSGRVSEALPLLEWGLEQSQPPGIMGLTSSLPHLAW